PRWSASDRPNVFAQLEAVLDTGLASLLLVLTGARKPADNSLSNAAGMCGAILAQHLSTRMRLASVHGAMADCSVLISKAQATALLDDSVLTSFAALAGLSAPLVFFPPGMTLPTNSELVHSYAHLNYLQQLQAALEPVFEELGYEDWSPFC
ncbi:hypothetical protein T492DRAFT_894879, partial [Pavlovales sp. CCMP2436]